MCRNEAIEGVNLGVKNTKCLLPSSAVFAAGSGLAYCCPDKTDCGISGNCPLFEQRLDCFGAQVPSEAARQRPQKLDCNRARQSRPLSLEMPKVP
jgi:hypothetical protein